MDQMVILEEDPENIQRKQTCMDLCRIHIKQMGNQNVVYEMKIWLNWANMI